MARGDSVTRIMRALDDYIDARIDVEDCRVLPKDPDDRRDDYVELHKKLRAKRANIEAALREVFSSLESSIDEARIAQGGELT